MDEGLKARVSLGETNRSRASSCGVTLPPLPPCNDHPPRIHSRDLLSHFLFLLSFSRHGHPSLYPDSARESSTEAVGSGRDDGVPPSGQGHLVLLHLD